MEVKFSPDLFLESHELNRFKESLDTEGWRLFMLRDVITFGIVNNSTGGAFDNSRVEQGTNAGTIKHAEGFAIDKNGEFIRKDATDNIAVTDDNNWYWVKIKYQVDNTEDGIVSVDINGNLTGVGTLFTEVLRGTPNIPSRVKFQGATLNTIEYDVQEVIDDTNVVLSGVFQAESNLQLIVVGSFTPDANPPASDKDIFDYDGAIFTQVLEVVLNTPPSLIADEEFLIARIRNNAGVISIEDKRNSIFRLKADYLLQNIDRASTRNPLIGVEAVKFDDDFSTKEMNVVEMAWGMRSTNWSIDTAINRVTFIGAEGGKFKTTLDFTDGDFDGWRLYTKDGSYSIIRTSALSGSQINFQLDKLDPDNYIDTGQELLVVPDTDSIRISIKSDVGTINSLVSRDFFFSINTPVARMNWLVFGDPTSTYNVKYAHQRNSEYTELVAIPTDTVNGYLTEASFNAVGTQIATIRQTYTSSETLGFIILTIKGDAFKKVIDKIDLGDFPGVNRDTLDNANPVKVFTVGTSKQIQIFEGILTISTNHFFSLDTTGAVEGNRFFFKFENITTLSGQTLHIVQDFVNPGSPGTLLLDFGADTNFWLDRAAENNMYIEVIFDGTNWVIYPDASVTRAILDLVISGALLADGSIPVTGLLLYDANVTGKSGWPNDRGVPDKGYVDAQDTAIVGGAPASLDTLNELAAAIADDPNFSAAVMLLDGTQSMTGNMDMGTNRIENLGISNSVDDAVRQDQVLRLAAGQSTAILNMGAFRIENLGASNSIDDAVRRDEAVLMEASTPELRVKVINIGDWDMDATANVSISHGLTFTKIRSVIAMIRHDTLDVLYDINYIIDSTLAGGLSANLTDIFLFRVTSGFFDATTFDATSFNRGFIMITYEL